MVSETARALAVRLLAGYPGWPITELSILALADTLDRIGLEVAEEVVSRAQIEFLKPPSVAQIHELAREVRREVADAERPALPRGTAEEAIAEMPPEVRERVERMTEKWAETADDEKADVNEEWQRRLESARRFGSLTNVKACSGAGHAPVTRDGKRVCPDCGVEVPVEVMRVPRRHREATA